MAAEKQISDMPGGREETVWDKAVLPENLLGMADIGTAGELAEAVQESLEYLTDLMASAARLLGWGTFGIGWTGEGFGGADTLLSRRLTRGILTEGTWPGAGELLAAVARDGEERAGWSGEMPAYDGRPAGEEDSPYRRTRAIRQQSERLLRI